MRLRVGDGVVDFAAREVHMPGARAPRRVTPKAIGVLRLLARAPGAVVGRNELLAEVWPDTLPTDDVLTQAVTQLRKAFGAGTVGAEAGKRYIETIAKGGYRLTVPVDVEITEATEVVESSGVLPALSTSAGLLPTVAVDETAASTQLSARTKTVVRRGSRWRLASIALAVAALVAFGIWVAFESIEIGGRDARGAGPSPVTRPYRLITNAAGFELSPTLSPDASMVAYSATGGMEQGPSHSAILVQATSSSVPRVLTRPPPDARDDLPAWSPDGRDIAFARWEASGACRILLIVATGLGGEREIARCDGSDLLSFGWLPDGSGLLFGTMTGADDGARLRILDRRSGQWRPLNYAGESGDIDFAPQISPDGKWIGFIRNPQMGDLWRVPLDGGEPEQITHLGAELRGWSWSPDSDAMVFGLRVDSEARLYRADVETGRIADLGINDAQSPTVSARTGMMAFVHRRPQFGLYRIAASGAWERLFTSSGRDSQPTLAPDGNQLVFTSDRAGQFELWWAALGAPQSLRPIAGVRPDTRQAPAWSLDSRLLLVAALDEQNSPIILEVEPGSGRAERLPLRRSRPAQAVYGPAGIIFVIENGPGDGNTSLAAYDRNTWRVVGRIDDVSQVRFDHVSDRVVYSRLGANGLWVARPNLDPASVMRISDRIPTRWRYRSWTLGPDGTVSYLAPVPECRTHLSRYRLTASAVELIDADCVDPATHSATNGFSAGNMDWFVSLPSEDGSDIGYMALPAGGTTDEWIPKWLIRIAK